MALIACPDCGCEVSDTAICCPKCGYDIYVYSEEIKYDKLIEEKVKRDVEKIRPPKLYSDVKEIPGYKEENDVEICAFLLGFSISVLVIFLMPFCLIPALLLWVVGLILSVVLYKNAHSKRIEKEKQYLKSENDKKQAIIDNFEEYRKKELHRLRVYYGYEKEIYMKKISQARQGIVYTNNSKSSSPAKMVNGIMRCPVCGDLNSYRISTTSRMVSVGTVGLASGKIGKQYKCKTCKHMW